MSLNTPRSTAITTKEERERKLKTFMLDQIGPSSDHRADAIALVAQSPSSAVVSALLSLSETFADRGIGASIILTGGAVAAANETWNLVFSSRFVHEIRLTSNPRVLDGHEQLIVGDTASWFGDCMRRDPAKTDTFEKFTPNAPAEARAARMTFARLWNTAQPVYTSAAIADISVARLAAASQSPQKTTSAWDLTGPSLTPANRRMIGNAQDLLETLRVWRPLTRH